MRRAVQLESARGPGESVQANLLLLSVTLAIHKMHVLSHPSIAYTPLFPTTLLSSIARPTRPAPVRANRRPVKLVDPPRIERNPYSAPITPDLHRPPRNGGQGGLNRRDCMGLHGGLASLAGGDERARTRGSRGDSRAWVVLKGSNRPSTSLARPAPPANCMVIL